MTELGEKYAQLNQIIARHRDEPGGLMPVMQEAQALFGALPMEVQEVIADGMGKTLSEVYGVATFYAQFALAPKGKYVISVCMGTACYVKGAQAVLDKLSEYLEIPVGETTEDGEFTLDATRCIGACGLAPVMTVNDDVYGRITPDQVAGILDKYRA
ncbi:MAG: NAD(P)H-dependent oxidoreductase subunit E [Clostridiales bacterium]|nr:NAD(P)H-dependent oxidoreductase subunit E [Clostridiales bacterium]